ncbi:hypothetical protein HOLleu_17191 [Holothuria leucospilota]|uniref:Uncharacterized protein n=1 Tax=Holothuria leucospilota TaxID=206669 RepID=A0A9Q1HBK5_HOLLE|nr:hypothetical protein HOLleu_17191 [Holothuria leucospilota]
MRNGFPGTEGQNKHAVNELTDHTHGITIGTTMTQCTCPSKPKRRAVLPFKIASSWLKSREGFHETRSRVSMVFEGQDRASLEVLKGTRPLCHVLLCVCAYCVLIPHCMQSEPEAGGYRKDAGMNKHPQLKISLLFFQFPLSVQTNDSHRTENMNELSS